MIYPSIDKILNIVDSKYALVYVVSDRAKQMTKTGYYQMPIKDYKCQKNRCNIHYTFKYCIPFYIPNSVN